MNDPRVSDRLTGQITRTAETLAACERNVQSAHALLHAAHRQMERSRALHRRLDALNHLHHSGPFWYTTRDPIDAS